MLSFCGCERVGGVEGDERGTGKEWEGRWKRVRDGEEEESKDRSGEDGRGRGLSMREMSWGGGRE